MRKLISKHPFTLSFGIFQIFFSSPGQTFLIAFFIPSIYKNFVISDTLESSIYSAATFIAALFLWLGAEELHFNSGKLNY